MGIFEVDNRLAFQNNKTQIMCMSHYVIIKLNCQI